MKKFLIFCTKVLFVVVFIFLRITLFLPWLITVLCYKIFFSKRCEYTQKRLYVEDFENLKEEKLNFYSGKYKLQGGLYTNPNVDSNGWFLIFSHGIGCGKNNYYNNIDYFTNKGYTVFAYDVTGCCDSEGNGIGGLPQAVKDLDNALKYAIELPQAKGKKLALFGHSWGAYASASILNMENTHIVDAVALVSGFDDYMDVLYYQSYTYAGDTMRLARNYLKFMDWSRYGKYIHYKSIDGINKYKKPVFVAHSDNDTTVPIKMSIYNKKDKCTNDKAEFHLYEGKGHTISRPLQNTKNIDSCEKSEAKIISQTKESAFKMNFDNTYRNADIKDVYAVDIDFMDEIHDFYTRANNSINN